MAYDNHPFEEQELFLSGVYLEGVQGVTTNWSLPDDDIMSLGFVTPIAGTPNSNFEGEVTINRLVVSSEDPLTGFFNQGVSGHYKYGDDYAYLFDQGYITNYSCICETSEIPQLDTTLKTFGTIKGSAPGYVDQPGPETYPNNTIYLPNVGDVKLEITNHNDSDPKIDISTDLVEAFEYTVDVDWEPLYGVGSLNPLEYYNRGAAVVQAVITLDINKTVTPDFHSLICSPTLKDISLTIFSCGDNCDDEKTVVRKFTTPCAKLVEYNNIATNLEVLTAEIVFKSVNTPVTQLAEILS